MDKFPEAFDRAEKEIDVKEIKTFEQLIFQFESWQKYSMTRKQINAMAPLAKDRGINPILRVAIAYRQKKTGEVKIRPAYRDMTTGKFTKETGEYKPKEYTVRVVTSERLGQWAGMNYLASKAVGFKWGRYGKNTILVDKKYSKTERKEIVQHEITERNEMRLRIEKGMSYEQAYKESHDIANKTENIPKA